MTGGSRGIGFGCAEQLAKLGFNVAINGMRDESAISEPIEALKALGADALYCQGDISSADARAAMLAKIKDQLTCRPMSTRSCRHLWTRYAASMDARLIRE